MALQADPLMWVSFRALCEAGAAEHWHVPDGAREVITRAEPEAGADTVATGRTPDALAAPTPATPQAPRPSRPPLYGGSTETGTSGPALPPSGTHQRYGRQIRFEVSPETPAVGDVGMRQVMRMWMWIRMIPGEVPGCSIAAAPRPLGRAVAARASATERTIAEGGSARANPRPRTQNLLADGRCGTLFRLRGRARGHARDRDAGGAGEGARG